MRLKGWALTAAAGLFLALGAAALVYEDSSSHFAGAASESPRHAASLSSAEAAKTTPPAQAYDRRGGNLDVTFIVASDTHLGFESGEFDDDGQPHDPVANPRGVEVINAQSIAAMNAMPGRSWPGALTGNVDEPRGVLISGDLTEDGIAYEWRHFAAFYGLTGTEGVLRYPAFEGHGNHDKHASRYVPEQIQERHGALRYCIDWDDLHLVNLGEAPDEAGLEFLQKDLERVGKRRPVVVYLHFPMNQRAQSCDSRGSIRWCFSSAPAPLHGPRVEFSVEFRTV